MNIGRGEAQEVFQSISDCIYVVGVIWSGPRRTWRLSGSLRAKLLNIQVENENLKENLDEIVQLRMKIFNF